MGLFNLLFGRMIDKRINYYQNDTMQNHIEEVENIYRQMRGWRHDYHNHIQTMIALIDGDNSTDNRSSLRDYLLTLNDDLTTIDTIIKTGNIMVDATLNSKISLATSKNIKINAKAVVPQSLSISSIDFCAIIGNLLDNALEACLKQDNESERFIRVYIGILKGQLYISVTNSYGGKVTKQGHKYLSTKSLKRQHSSFGLMRVDTIANKYSGYVNRQNEDGVFATEVMLPL